MSSLTVQSRPDTDLRTLRCLQSMERVDGDGALKGDWPPELPADLAVDGILNHEVHVRPKMGGSLPSVDVRAYAAFERIMAHLESADLGLEFEPPKLIGGGVRKLFDGARLAAALGVTGEVEVVGTDETLPDVDFSVRVITDRKDPLATLKKAVINAVAALIKEGSDQEIKIKTVASSGFHMLATIDRPATQMLLVKIGDGAGSNLELKFWLKVKRTHLFTVDALHYSPGAKKIKGVAKGNPHQSLVDLAAKLVRVQEPKTVNEKGWPRMVAYFLQGFTAVGGAAPALLKTTARDDPIELLLLMENCLENHHPMARERAVVYFLNASLELIRQGKPELARDIWSTKNWGLAINQRFGKTRQTGLLNRLKGGLRNANGPFFSLAKRLNMHPEELEQVIRELQQLAIQSGGATQVKSHEGTPVWLLTLEADEKPSTLLLPIDVELFIDACSAKDRDPMALGAVAMQMPEPVTDRFEKALCWLIKNLPIDRAQKLFDVHSKRWALSPLKQLAALTLMERLPPESALPLYREHIVSSPMDTRVRPKCEEQARRVFPLVADADPKGSEAAALFKFGEPSDDLEEAVLASFWSAAVTRFFVKGNDSTAWAYWGTHKKRLAEAPSELARLLLPATRVGSDYKDHVVLLTDAWLRAGHLVPSELAVQPLLTFIHQLRCGKNNKAADALLERVVLPHYVLQPADHQAIAAAVLGSGIQPKSGVAEVLTEALIAEGCTDLLRQLSGVMTRTDGQWLLMLVGELEVRGYAAANRLLQECPDVPVPSKLVSGFLAACVDANAWTELPIWIDRALACEGTAPTDIVAIALTRGFISGEPLVALDVMDELEVEDPFLDLSEQWRQVVNALAPQKSADMLLEREFDGDWSSEIAGWAASTYVEGATLMKLIPTLETGEQQQSAAVNLFNRMLRQGDTSPLKWFIEDLGLVDDWPDTLDPLMAMTFKALRCRTTSNESVIDYLGALAASRTFKNRVAAEDSDLLVKQIECYLAAKVSGGTARVVCMLMNSTLLQADLRYPGLCERALFVMLEEQKDTEGCADLWALVALMVVDCEDTLDFIPLLAAVGSGELRPAVIEHRTFIKGAILREIERERGAEGGAIIERWANGTVEEIDEAQAMMGLLSNMGRQSLPLMPSVARIVQIGAGRECSGTVNAAITTLLSARSNFSRFSHNTRIDLMRSLRDGLLYMFRSSVKNGVCGRSMSGIFNDLLMVPLNACVSVSYAEAPLWDEFSLEMVAGVIGIARDIPRCRREVAGLSQKLLVTLMGRAKPERIDPVRLEHLQMIEQLTNEVRLSYESGEVIKEDGYYETLQLAYYSFAFKESTSGEVQAIINRLRTNAVTILRAGSEEIQRVRRGIANDPSDADISEWIEGCTKA